MTDRPIPFKPAMVRAILEGRKTQTRRISVARWKVGGRLWVREAWQALPEFDHLPPREIPPGSQIIHLAERDSFRWDSRYRHSQFMPRWASRLTLIVEDVRVQRLREISCADAISEGIRAQANSATIDGDTPDPRDAFWMLWDSINGKRYGCSWRDNPFVAAITFRAIKANIDSAEVVK